MLSAGSRSGRLTVALINLAAVIERAEEQLLPSVFFWISQSFNASPTQLGSITLCRALVQAVTSPIAGAAGDALDRRIIVGVGCMIWSCSNLAIAASRQLGWAMAFAGINGLGLSLVVPCSQSLIADYSEESARGRAFGAMAFVGSVGGMLGGVFAINLSHFSPLGVQGWRVAFALMAALGMLTGALVVALAVDPRAQQKALAAMDARQKAGAGADGRICLLLRSLQSSAKQILADMRYMLLLPTFQVIILQGIVGSVPWQAMAFLTLFLQLLGFSDFSASMLMAVSAVASAIGSWLGGVVGDLAARRSPNSGRAYTAQFSVACGLPLAAMLFCWTPADGLPASGAALWPYLLLLSAMGLTITWTPAACNSPLFAEVVPVDMRSRIYAFDRGFEGGVAACAAPLVGAMASSFFGYDVQHGTSDDAELNHRNAVALGKSLLLWLEVPWILCLIFYSGLHWVYPRDRRRLQQQLKQSAGLPMLS